MSKEKIRDIQKVDKTNEDYYVANGYYKGFHKYALLRGDKLRVVTTDTKKYYEYVRHYDTGQTKGLRKEYWNQVLAEDLPEGVILL
jgi:hypothetical protein